MKGYARSYRQGLAAWPVRGLLLSMLLAWLVAGQSVAAAEALAVVVSPDNPISALSRKQIVYIYMGRQKQYSHGERVLPLDLGERSQARAQFYHNLMGKGIAEINAYWARLVFSGRSTPPMALPSPADIVETVMDNPGAIAYLPISQVPQQLKVVYTLKQGFDE